MTRNDIIQRIAENMPKLSEKDIAYILNLTLETMADAMLRGETIELRNFGVFDCVERKPRTGHNFHTQEGKVHIPAARASRFRLGRLLKEKLNTTRPLES